MNRLKLESKNAKCKIVEDKKYFLDSKSKDNLSGQIRRYLADIDASDTSQLSTDCLVIGAGIAGLRAAIEAAQICKVIVVCKGQVSDSNTWNAQGGIAVVFNPLKADSPQADSFESHIADTLKTGCSLCDEETVELVIRQGPELIQQLLDWGAEFDRTDGRIISTLEGGHSHPRVIHAHGDNTGRIIAEALVKIVRQNPNIKIIENFFTIDLITDNGRCLGVIGQNSQPKGDRQIIWAANTILATGGAGQLYRETSNPSCATGDGLAIAWRAGAVLQDLEFMQFHPTTLYIAGASRALITEAIRGEGAILRDSKGKAFMKDYHPDAELAPRDVVSRACLQQMLKTKATNVFLDVRHLDKQYFAKRFPYIYEICESFDIDISRDLIPVRPSAHYMVGGIKTDLLARTNVENLYACGEVASTGLHGANRLASNALLEGMVFGQIAGREAAKIVMAGGEQFRPHPIKHKIPHSDRTVLDTADVRNSLRSLMWRNVGITRSARPLVEAQQIIKFWQRYVMDKVFDTPAGWECQNMLTVSLLMACCAQMRRESRGVHFRTDYPNTDDKNFKRHTQISVQLSNP
jgi:L-aspartate oxidase